MASLGKEWRKANIVGDIFYRNCNLGKTSKYSALRFFLTSHVVIRDSVKLFNTIGM